MNLSEIEINDLARKAKKTNSDPVVYQYYIDLDPESGFYDIFKAYPDKEPRLLRTGQHGPFNTFAEAKRKLLTYMRTYRNRLTRIMKEAQNIRKAQVSAIE
jgi:hypothetical protein